MIRPSLFIGGRIISGQRGFTLIETMVSVFLLAVMSVMSYQAIEAVMGIDERSRHSLADEAQLQRAWRMIAGDIIHLRARTFNDGLGIQEPAYVTNKAGFGVRFSRGGGPMLGSNPSGIRRIDYSLNEDQQLVRKSWAISESPRYSDGHHLVLLDHVSQVTFEQLDPSDKFTPNWPPLGHSLSNRSLPKMIRVTIELENGTDTSRLFLGVMQ